MLVLFQIVALNAVFAARSVVTASAMASRVEVAMAAMLAAFWFLLRLSRPLARRRDVPMADDGLDRAAGVRQSDGLGLTSASDIHMTCVPDLRAGTLSRNIGPAPGRTWPRFLPGSPAPGALPGGVFMTGVSWIFQVRLSAE